MHKIPTEATAAGSARPADLATEPERSSSRAAYALVAGVAFGLYWVSSFLLEARHATTHFGADAHLYTGLAQGDVLDRVARFHPLTVVMALAWMRLLGFLTSWITPLQLLKAMFAAVGAAGVWAAMSAFAAVVPRRAVPLCGVIYAVSFGVWYFSSIEESKIVTASLASLYIAIYLRLRERWTTGGAVLLTVTLLLACLNEVVSGFLIVIPVVDVLMRHGWDWRQARWIAVHALAGPAALLVLEGVVNGRFVAASTDAEGGSHLSMLIFYILKNDHSLASLYSFVLNWLFFNIAAPTPNAPRWAGALPNYAGDFEPALVGYLSSPVSVGLTVVFGVLILASVLPLFRARSMGNSRAILLALAAYAVLRCGFFFVFNPAEPLLFSPAVTLAHMLMIGIPLAASNFPAKGILLGLFATLLFVGNGAFMIGR